MNNVSISSAPAEAMRGGRASAWLIRMAKAAILASAFLAPLLYLPLTPDVLFIKVVFVEAAGAAAVAAWLLASFFSRKISYVRSPLNPVFLALAVILVASAILSSSPWASVLGPDVTGEKAGSALAFLALSFAASALFTKRDVRRLLAVFTISFAVLGIFVLVSVLLGRAGVQLPAWLNANPVGTVNALALVLALGFLVSFWFAALPASQGSGRSRFWTWFGFFAAAILFACLVFIGFRMMWIGLAATLLVLAALHSAFLARRPENGEGGLIGRKALALLFIALLASVFMVFKPAPFSGMVYQPPLEVSPSLRSTLAIGGKSLSARPLLGFGPANFREPFSRFRDPALNSTVFWASRFNHGYSFLTTLPSTAGALGLLAYLAFSLVVVVLVIRGLLAGREASPEILPLGAAVLFGVLMWFLYAGNFVASFILFLGAGMIVALVAKPVSEPPAPETAGSAGSAGASGIPSDGYRLRLFRFPRPRFSMEVVRGETSFEAPALNFVVSLVAVFAAAFALVFFWLLASHYAAEVYARRAARAFNLYGNADTAKAFLERAIRLHSNEASYYQARVQVAIFLVNRIVAEAASSPGRDFSSAFRQEFSDGVSAGQRAAALAPQDPNSWIALGSLYEAVIPFVDGADRASREAYGRARDADPTNPAPLFLQGRAELTMADALQISAASAPSGDQQKRLFEGRAQALSRGREALQKALELKPDYASAHFLLAQIAIRENNLDEAIAKTEAAAFLAPADIGAAFQLGLLYYRANRLDEAKQAFERAVALNDNYSNARYFLGLIWDRKGDKDAALSQFVKIAALNPDNDEVRRIVANLEAGRPALAEIVPPAPAPETRKEAPVREGVEKTPLKR